MAFAFVGAVDPELTALQQKVIAAARTVFGDDDQQKVTEWVNTPKPALGGKTPFECIRDAEGCEKVITLLGQIEHGVYP